MNGFNIFKTGVFTSRGNWASATDFCGYFEKDFSKLEFDKSAVITKINELTKPDNDKTKIGRVEAAKILFAQDLAKIRKNIAKIEFIDPENEININFEKLKKLLAKFGIIYNHPLFIVDHFPKPYDFFDRNGTSGTQFDDSDNKAFGLEQGIYLKRQRLNPFTSSLLMAHELIHAVIGLRDSNFLARGLEEGFTQFFGEFYLGGQIFGYQTALNYEINRRLSYPVENQQWEQYTDWLRQGCIFYQKFGIDGMIELMKQGRGLMKKADESMLQGRLNELKLPKGKWIKELDSAAETILSFNRNLVYSPLAVYLAQNIKLGESVDRLFLRLDIKAPEGQKALKELNERIFSILINKNKIAIDDTKLYLQANNLRYEIPSASK